MLKITPVKNITPYFDIEVWGLGNDRTVSEHVVKNVTEITTEEVKQIIEILSSLNGKESINYPYNIFSLLTESQIDIINTYIPQDEDCPVSMIEDFKVTYVDELGRLHNVTI